MRMKLYTNIENFSVINCLHLYYLVISVSNNAFFKKHNKKYTSDGQNIRYHTQTFMKMHQHFQKNEEKKMITWI